MRTNLIAICTILLIFFTSPVYTQVPTTLDAQAPKKILVMGDSLSAAYKLPVEQGWVYLLQERLTEQRYNVKVENASVSGATTAAGLQILPLALEKHQPDLVLLELGANDGLQGKPVEYIRKNLVHLITMAQTAGSDVILVGIRLPPNFGPRYTEPFYAQYAALAKEHAVPLVPFLLEGVAGNPDLMMSDGLHPNEKGQKPALENVWGEVENWVEQNAATSENT